MQTFWDKGQSRSFRLRLILAIHAFDSNPSFTLRERSHMISAAEGKGFQNADGCWQGSRRSCIQDTLSSRARLAECVARAKASCIQPTKLLQRLLNPKTFLTDFVGDLIERIQNLRTHFSKIIFIIWLWSHIKFTWQRSVLSWTR